MQEYTSGNESGFILDNVTTDAFAVCQQPRKITLYPRKVEPKEYKELDTA